ncbi:MAG: hypothetical protein ACR2G6_12740 [Gemmatimonadaceae bacterium]
MTVNNRVGAVALGIAALAVGGVFLVFGLALLIAVAVIGIALGGGVLLYRKLMGRGARMVTPVRPAGLDPAKEVFPAGDPRGSIGVSSQDTAVPDRGEL